MTDGLGVAQICVTLVVVHAIFLAVVLIVREGKPLIILLAFRVVRKGIMPTVAPIRDRLRFQHHPLNLRLNPPRSARQLENK